MLRRKPSSQLLFLPSYSFPLWAKLFVKSFICYVGQIQRNPCQILWWHAICVQEPWCGLDIHLELSSLISRPFPPSGRTTVPAGECSRMLNKLFRRRTFLSNSEMMHFVHVSFGVSVYIHAMCVCVYVYTYTWITHDKCISKTVNVFLVLVDIEIVSPK